MIPLYRLVDALAGWRSPTVSEDGQTLADYGLILTLIAVGVTLAAMIALRAALPAGIALLLVGLLLAAVALTPSGPRPAEAAGLDAVSAGGGHTCALTTAGGVKCWGL